MLKGCVLRQSILSCSTDPQSGDEGKCKKGLILNQSACFSDRNIKPKMLTIKDMPRDDDEAHYRRVKGSVLESKVTTFPIAPPKKKNTRERRR